MTKSVFNIILTACAAGLSSLLIGALLPIERFEPDSFLFSAKEGEPKIYDKLSIRKWKEKLPDLSKMVDIMYPKNVIRRPTAVNTERLIQETCLAEYVHLFLMALSPLIFAAEPGPLGAVAALLFFLGNIPFIMVQRYNRPKLCALHEKLVIRENKKASDTLAKGESIK